MCIRDSITIIAYKVNITYGLGTYAKLTIGNITIKPKESISLTFISGDKIISYKNVDKLIIIVNEPITVLVKKPSIDALGSIMIKKLYTFIAPEPWSALPREAALQGDDLFFKGQIRFKVLVSDAITIVNNLMIKGSDFQSTKRAHFNEIETLSIAIFWMMIISVILMSIFMAIYNNINNKHDNKIA